MRTFIDSVAEVVLAVVSIAHFIVAAGLPDISFGDRNSRIGAGTVAWSGDGRTVII